jgi:hypothetical protein
MRDGVKIDPALRRRLRSAEGKLREARMRLSRAERSVQYWTRKLADLRHEKTRTFQPPLWPEEAPEESAKKSSENS